MSRIDRIHIYEIVDHLKNPSNYIEFMGFGRDPSELRAKPARSPEAVYTFAQSMAAIVEGLGKNIDKITAELELATATQDIPYKTGVIRAGTVAGQHYEWTAWADGAPLVIFHTFWTMGEHSIEPQWQCGGDGYRVVIDGEPKTELILQRAVGIDAVTHTGPGWTAMSCVNVIPAVCDARPGFVTHFDLGVVRPRGLVRPASQPARK